MGRMERFTGRLGLMTSRGGGSGIKRRRWWWWRGDAGNKGGYFFLGGGGLTFSVLSLCSGAKVNNKPAGYFGPDV